MKPVEANDYFELVMKGFAHIEQKYETEEMTVVSEDIFKLIWMSSVRFDSFITFADEIDVYSFRNYVMQCLGMSRRGRSKLGIPSVCNAVVITENAPKAVIESVIQRPSMHASITEYPVVVDLVTGEAHYFTGPILYGLLRVKFEREYIDGHFALPLRFLSKR